MNVKRNCALDDAVREALPPEREKGDFPSNKAETAGKITSSVTREVKCGMVSR